MDETQLKQQFLRSEILGKGYDATDFTDFLAEKRENGDDLDNWTKNSLELVVAEFQQNFDPQDSEDEDSEEEEAQSSIYRHETESVYFNDNDQPEIGPS